MRHARENQLTERLGNELGSVWNAPILILERRLNIRRNVKVKRLDLSLVIVAVVDD